MRKKTKLVAAPSSTFLITCAATNEVFYRPVLAFEISNHTRWVITNSPDDGDIDADELGFEEYFATGLLDDKGRVFCGCYLFQTAQEFIAFCKLEFESNSPASRAKKDDVAHPLNYELLSEADVAALSQASREEKANRLKREAQAQFAHADALEAIRNSRPQ
jgi:hypothetical protein